MLQWYGLLLSAICCLQGGPGNVAGHIPSDAGCHVDGALTVTMVTSISPQVSQNQWPPEGAWRCVGGKGGGQ